MGKKDEKRAAKTGKRQEKEARKAAKQATRTDAKTSKAAERATRPVLTAANADRHDLYQRAVQNPADEVKFVAKTFRELRAREAIALREDFCGTALFSACWARLTPPARTATGLDIDPEVLAWGRAHNLANLGELEPRVRLLEQDVRVPTAADYDLVTAFNFSYWCFKTRDALRAYFAAVHASLREDGLFFLDAYGGWESHEPMTEKRSIDGSFTYVWQQAKVCPIDNGVVNHIHFRFKDGTRLERAFTYDWRLWSLPEISELLAEAGFASVSVYWDVASEGEDEDYQPRRSADNQPGWLAYLVACK